ncbi:hypothetical protein KKC91_03765 [bacterium]|nr:hypothetical protein [bacterium]
MKTQEIKNEFEKILSDVIKLNGLSPESAVLSAQLILQEAGKDRRTEMIREAKSDNGNEDVTATFNQKKAMRNLKISFSEDIGKKEASTLIEQAVSKFNKGKPSSSK